MVLRAGYSTNLAVEVLYEQCRGASEETKKWCGKDFRAHLRTYISFLSLLTHFNHTILLSARHGSTNAEWRYTAYVIDGLLRLECGVQIGRCHFARRTAP